MMTKTGAFVDEPCAVQPDTPAAAGDHGDLAASRAISDPPIRVCAGTC